MNINMRKRAVFFGAVLAACLSSPSLADWQPDLSDNSQKAAAVAIEKFKTRKPELSTYFDQAYGYAIIPGITRVAVGFGGAYGRGLVIKQDSLIGRTSFSQLTGGIQLGAKYFSMIVFFKDSDALEEYKEGRFRFLGQAGIDLLTVGVSGTPAYNEGVALFSMTKLGLMAEFSYSGARFSYRPIVIAD